MASMVIILLFTSIYSSLSFWAQRITLSFWAQRSEAKNLAPDEMPFSTVKAGCFAFGSGRQPKNGRFQLFIFSLFLSPFTYPVCTEWVHFVSLLSCRWVVFWGILTISQERGEDDIPIYLSWKFLTQENCSVILSWVLWGRRGIAAEGEKRQVGMIVIGQ